MKERIKNLWVTALRSGNYKQGKHALKNKNNEFCCLGVLCDISEQGEWNEKNLYLFMGSSLPAQVMEWAGMKTHLGKFKYKSLAALNDADYSFEEIADVIEKHWEEL